MSTDDNGVAALIAKARRRIPEKADSNSAAAAKWYPVECEHGYDCCPQCDGPRRDPLTLKPIN